MADHSAIEWTEATWNPTTGCDRVSPGCDNCYALTLAARLKKMGQPKYQRDGDPRTSGPGFGLTVHDDALTMPLRWRRPRRVFVNSMSDLFHDDVPDEFIARVFAAMMCVPQHTFQILTKRHGRMRSLLRSEAFYDQFVAAAEDMPEHMRPMGAEWPLRNAWLGVSVENQQWADIRVPALLDTPATVRWLSCEPLLGPIDLHVDDPDDVYQWCSFLDWVVVGGESGLAARPMHVAWARQLRDQCTAAGVPFFFKQWGGRTPKAGGRELDGRTWDQYPQTCTGKAAA